MSRYPEDRRDYIKFNILLPLVTKLDSLYQAQMAIEQGAHVNESAVYNRAVDQVEQLISESLLEEYDWMLLQTETDDGCTKVAYMSDLRRNILGRRSELLNQINGAN